MFSSSDWNGMSSMWNGRSVRNVAGCGRSALTMAAKTSSCWYRSARSMSIAIYMTSPLPTRRASSAGILVHFPGGLEWMLEKG